MTFKCNTDWYDSKACKFYEEGREYDIDLDHMAELGTLKRFNGAEDYKKAKPEVKKPKKAAKTTKQPDNFVIPEETEEETPVSEGEK